MDRRSENGVEFTSSSRLRRFSSRLWNPRTLNTATSNEACMNQRWKPRKNPSDQLIGHYAARPTKKAVRLFKRAQRQRRLLLPLRAERRLSLPSKQSVRKANHLRSLIPTTG